MTGYAWLDGAIVPLEDCVVHARSQGGFWGANVFEGIRAYWQPEDGSFRLFRLTDHLQRLSFSQSVLRMPRRFDDEAITQAIATLLRVNDVRADVHVCVVAYFGTAPNLDNLGFTDSCGMHITAIAAPRSPRHERGIEVCVSSWRRITDDTSPPRVKTGANYHNSRLAHHEAVRNGYDTALLLNQRGTVAEAPTSCLVMVRDGRLVTPPATAGALEGLTLDTLGVLAVTELGLELERREIDRSELYAADEVFLCGTLAEITPVVTIDRLAVGDGRRGPLTQQLQVLYDREVRYGSSERTAWRTLVSVAPSEQVEVTA